MYQGLLYSKGEIVVCPTCKDRIAELRDHVFSGMRLDCSLFIWLNQSFSPRELFNCKKCGSVLFRNGGFTILNQQRHYALDDCDNVVTELTSEDWDKSELYRDGFRHLETRRACYDAN